MFPRFITSTLILLTIELSAFSDTVKYEIPDGLISRLVLTAKTNGGSSSVTWQTDRGSYCLRLDGQKNGEIDDIHGSSYRVSLLDSLSNVIDEKRVTPSESSPFPFRITIDSKCHLIVTTTGDKTIIQLDNIGNPVPGTEISITGEKKNGIVYHDCNIDYLPLPELFDGEILEDERGHGGTWSYLDAVTPKRGDIVIGGKYKLEIIPDPANDGYYLAVYRGGGTVGAQLWEDGAIKARFKPTHFEGHYDVEWYDAKNALISDDVNATFQGDNILVIEFPVLEALIRFSRPLNE